MGNRVRRSSARVAGDTEVVRLAATLGQAARSARRASRRTLEAVAEEARISRTRLSEIERGEGASAPLSSWVTLGIVLRRPLSIAFSRPIDGSLRDPVDAGHLVIQEHLLALARATGRHGTFEVPTRPLDPARSTDVGIRDAPHRVRILAECWNTFGDLGAAARSTNRKTAEAAATWPDDRIATVWVVRASAANRAIVGTFPHVIAGAFPGSSRGWVRALTVRDAAPPTQPGLVWFDPATKRLTEWRRATMAA